MPKDKVKGKRQAAMGEEKREALKAVMSGLGLMVAAAGMPGQVRLASREQQPLPPASVPPKKSGKGSK
jgi:hypothetical protein